MQGVSNLVHVKPDETGSVIEFSVQGVSLVEPPREGTYILEQPRQTNRSLASHGQSLLQVSADFALRVCSFGRESGIGIVFCCFE
jgi:hypothetical protein